VYLNTIGFGWKNKQEQLISTIIAIIRTAGDDDRGRNTTTTIDLNNEN